MKANEDFLLWCYMPTYIVAAVKTMISVNSDKSYTCMDAARCSDPEAVTCVL